MSLILVFVAYYYLQTKIPWYINLIGLILFVLVFILNRINCFQLEFKYFFILLLLIMLNFCALVSKLITYFVESKNIQKVKKKLNNKKNYFDVALILLALIISIYALVITVYSEGKNDAKNTEIFRVIESENLAIIYENPDNYICVPYNDSNDDTIDFHTDKYVIVEKIGKIISGQKRIISQSDKSSGKE